MKTRAPAKNRQALTLIEVLVIVGLLVLLAAMLLPALAKAKAKSSRINCANNLKQVGLAFRIWSGDNQDQFPMRVAAAEGGSREWVSTGKAWPHFQVLSNELNTPKVVVCPEDNRRSAATNFFSPGASAFADFTETHISYFIGLDTEESQTQQWLVGDDNLAVDDNPVSPGLLLLKTNDVVSWVGKRHTRIGPAGNLCFADARVEQPNNRELRKNLVQTGTATNRLAIP